MYALATPFTITSTSDEATMGFRSRNNNLAELHNEYLAIKATLGGSYEAGQSDPEAWQRYVDDKASLAELKKIFEP